ncbi:MAG: SDR family oxidoreductase, partial [Pseudomonadota bacterium]
MSERLGGKRTVVTGGTSGIGRDAVLRFVNEGARVVFSGRSRDGADETLAAVAAAGGEAHYVAQDVTREGDWQTLKEAIDKRLGGLDVLVNNAGAFWVRFIQDTTLADFRSMWRVNVDGTFM